MLWIYSALNAIHIATIPHSRWSLASHATFYMWVYVVIHFLKCCARYLSLEKFRNRKQDSDMRKSSCLFHKYSRRLLYRHISRCSRLSRVLASSFLWTCPGWFQVDNEYNRDIVVFTWDRTSAVRILILEVGWTTRQDTSSASGRWQRARGGWRQHHRCQAAKNDLGRQWLSAGGPFHTFADWRLLQGRGAYHCVLAYATTTTPEQLSAQLIWNHQMSWRFVWAIGTITL